MANINEVPVDGTTMTSLTVPQLIVHSDFVNTLQQFGWTPEAHVVKSKYYFYNNSGDIAITLQQGGSSFVEMQVVNSATQSQDVLDELMTSQLVTAVNKIYAWAQQFAQVNFARQANVF